MKKKATMQPNTDRFVHAIFCDDIRQEMGNKVSFMGCYQGELFLPFVPLMLPKLCVHVTISTPLERPFKSLTVRLDQGDVQLAVIDVPNGDFERTLPPQPENATRLSASVGVMLAPFNITEPSELRVVVITEEGEMPGPRLRLKVMSQADATATESAPRKGVAKKAAAPGAGARVSKLTK
jgi:hypothetical protein